MKIAIHHNPGSFSERWISYCRDNGIPFRIVTCFESDIVEQLEDCDALMWHWSNGDSKAILFARQLTYSLEAAGKKVFPNFQTAWHFDDKVGQKYLFEAIKAPFVPTYVAYSKHEALKWAEKSKFPQVMKLRGGAGASNVWLVHTKKDAKAQIAKAFGRGFKYTSVLGDLRTKITNGIRKKTLYAKIKRAPRTIWTLIRTKRDMPIEKGYVLFQEFIPHNHYDTRVVVIGDKAFGIRRYCRTNDFRASGSGNIAYDKELIPLRCLSISFDVAKRLNLQCGAFDFVQDEQGHYLIVEVSYGFVMAGYDPCPGYWNDQLVWHAGRFDPQAWMVENLIASLSVTNECSKIHY
jgi:glutathione synthase/RimK-type ligase-like ATP-grasp enzyme